MKYLVMLLFLVSCSEKPKQVIIPEPFVGQCFRSHIEYLKVEEVGMISARLSVVPKNKKHSKNYVYKFKEIYSHLTHIDCFKGLE